MEGNGFCGSGPGLGGRRGGVSIGRNKGVPLLPASAALKALVPHRTLPHLVREGVGRLGGVHAVDVELADEPVVQQLVVQLGQPPICMLMKPYFRGSDPKRQRLHTCRAQTAAHSNVPTQNGSGFTLPNQNGIETEAASHLPTQNGCVSSFAE